jgi:hypothetical protein
MYFVGSFWSSYFPIAINFRNVDVTTNWNEIKCLIIHSYVYYKQFYFGL